MNSQVSVRQKPGVPTVRAVERAAAILRAFASGRPHLSLSELARLASLDKSTARRLLHTLSSVELVEFDDATQTYALGPGILMLLPAVDFGRDLREASAPILPRLAERTGATSFLWTYFRDHALCLDRVRARDLHIDAPWSAVGTRIPLNCAGGPRVLLAYLPDDQRRQVLSKNLPMHTPYTETDPDKLEKACRAIRQRGWELAVDDYVMGLSGLGCPIFDRKGDLIASISITTLTPRLAPVGGKQPFLDNIIEAAAEIGARLQS